MINISFPPPLLVTDRINFAKAEPTIFQPKMSKFKAVIPSFIRFKQQSPFHLLQYTSHLGSAVSLCVQPCQSMPQHSGKMTP